MRIVREDIDLVPFGSISVGEVFIDTETNDAYMKIPKVYEIETNGAGQESRFSYDAVCLSDGQPYIFVDSDRVRIAHDTYLTVK